MPSAAAVRWALSLAVVTAGLALPSASAPEPSPASPGATVTATCAPGTPSTSPSAAPSAGVPSPASSAPSAATTTSWAVAGGYSGLSLPELRATGADHVLVELRWDRAEPAAGRFDEAYLRGAELQVARARSAGFEVVLNTGLQDAPDWLLREPGARFVDQHGRTYTASDEPNLVFGTALRAQAAEYLRELGSRVGDDVDVVRVGGGHWGELTYPRPSGADGSVNDSYWAFDEGAEQTTPVPGWEPGDPSPHREAQRFLDWYLDSLVDYQDWQVETVQRYFSGTVAVLYPSWGMRTGDFQDAVAGNLSGRTSAEINREVQMGIDHARQVGSLSTERTAVWGTWMEASSTDADDPPPFAELAGLAAARGLPLMGENGGGSTTVGDLHRVAALAREHHARLVMWVRLDDLLRGSAARAAHNNDAPSATAGLADLTEVVKR